MTIIRINKSMKERLQSLAHEGESMDSVVSRLIENISQPETVVEGSTNIRISEDTYAMLKNKKGKNESFSRTLERAIESSAQE